ncbi:MAG TPA: hypothetical protein VFJ14_07870 [Nocardioidaceae bacterium]|nr:hypothetical protein [Nocardioidaceae bacterium]
MSSEQRVIARTGPGALARRLLRWLVTPGTGLGFLWFLTLVGSLLVDAHGRLSGGFITLSCVVVWVSMLRVSASLPPPPKLSDQSALVARVAWFIKTVWAAFVFAAAAVYGALVGVEVDRLVTAGSSARMYELVTQSVWGVVAFVAVGAGWFAVMSCAWDLTRSGEPARRGVVTRLVAQAGNRAPEHSALGAELPWLGELMLWCTRGIMPWLFGYMAPPVVIGLWNSLAPNGDHAFRLF